MGIKELQDDFDRTTAEMNESFRRRNEVDSQARALYADLISGKVPAQEVPGKWIEYERLIRTLNGSQGEHEKICLKRNDAEVALLTARSRLAEAQRTVYVIDNPPGWDSEELSRHDKENIKKNAQKVIMELT
jgi:hypothetical protein